MYGEYLILINRVVGNVILVVTFSLCAYMTIRAWGAATARALTTLLFAVVVVSVASVLIRLAHESTVIELLLRSVWVGILLVPASLLHMVLGLTASLKSRRPNMALTIANYAIATVGILLGLTTDTFVSMPIRTGLVPALTPQPLFVLIAVYAFSLTTVSWIMLLRLRSELMTPGLRRRIGYMVVGWYGPVLLTFPVLSLLPTDYRLPGFVAVALATLAAPIAGILTVILAYSATFVGTTQPDRIVKHDFMRWWLYGPFIGMSIILFLQVVPIFARMSRLPVDVWSVFGIMAMTVVMPVLVSRIRPLLDSLIYASDQEEIDYLRTLPRTAFTQADLRRFLENTLTVICASSQSESAFVAAPDEFGVYTIKMLYGPRRSVRQLCEAHPLETLIAELAEHPNPEVYRAHGYRFQLLRDPDQRIIGLLGLHWNFDTRNADVTHLIQTLTHQIEHALVMVQVQQRLFDTLRSMAPEMSTLQRVSSRIEQATPEALEGLDDDVAMLPDFVSLVRDALTHFWGGPKLSDSPLLSLKAVKRYSEEQSVPPPKALQAMLRQAIETLKPEVDSPLTANESLLYSILDLRYIQGRKIRDIAQRLAMSESDLYRKQRIAVEEVARSLTMIEESVPDKSLNPSIQQ
ncbi:MAG: hypothetical protein DWI54_08225 [Chloroflexi bacterium]|nr:MAG: hypothetical protein DWI54_08225 [Chloroflexota bacterium]RLT30875.1 MAG: hypothetical protein DWI55_07130 [Chloroflexota bacterium]